MDLSTSAPGADDHSPPWADPRWRPPIPPAQRQRRLAYEARIRLPERLPTDPRAAWAPPQGDPAIAPQLHPAADARVDPVVERSLDVAMSTEALGLAPHMRPDLRAYAQRRLDEMLDDLAAIDEVLDGLVAARRTAVRLVQRYHRSMWRRAEIPHEWLPPFPAAIRRAEDPGVVELAGADLRQACRNEVVAAEGPMTVAEVRTALRSRGFDAAPVGRGPSPVVKAIAAALDREVRAGRLQRLARGIYAPP